MKPTPYHANFVRAGRGFARLVSPVVRLDLPDRLTVPTTRPVLFAGNHRSLFDFVATMAIFARFDMSSRLLIRADMVNGRFGGPLFRSIGSIATSSATREQAEQEAIAALLDGQLVSIMPEGRLIPAAERGDDPVGPARPGVSRIARQAGAVVIPVGFCGSEHVWPRDRYPRVRYPRRTVTIRLGEPLEVSGDDDQANTDEIMAHLGALVRRLENQRQAAA
ncbi:MAG: lysophospholipid acyltransferase family protein [Actinomycetota bacterium]